MDGTELRLGLADALLRGRARIAQRLRPVLGRHLRTRRALGRADIALGRWQHTLAQTFPVLIRPHPRQLTVAVTSACNLRCAGCRYGRDFMPGERLPLAMARQLLEDARACGVGRVRLYGGEPLLHPDLVEMVRCSTELGLDTYLTTNGILLGERIDELVQAGLRWATVGFYGVGQAYEAYTQRDGWFVHLERSLARVRERQGSRFSLQLNFVLVRPTCNLEALRAAWAFAERFEMAFHLDLYGYSMPFFTDGPQGGLRFRPEDRPVVEEVGRELVRLKLAHPQRFPQSLELVRSVPDWLLLGPAMRVPCDAYELLWVGADGTVQLCDVTFVLGNLRERRLRDMLFGPEHRRACREAFLLRCPNCTCKSDSRIRKHGASLRRYVS